MKLLTIFAPLALAATIPTVPKDWPARLDVRAKPITWTELEITIENKSPKAFNILKAGSIIDDNRLESMSLRGKGACGVGFYDSGTLPHTNARDESEFQLMPAYGSVTTTIDLLDVRKAFRFCGNAGSFLFIEATIHVAEVGGTTLVHEIPYKLDFAPIYHEYFPPLPEAFEERVYKCSPDYLSVLKEGIRGCASQATAAREAALNGSAERMKTYFQDSSQETRNSVADTFAKVAEVCNLKNPRLYITCNHSRCVDKAFAAVVRNSDPGHLILCKRGYFQPMFPDINEISSVTHTIVHEMTHLAFVKATRDIKYGLHASTNLDKDQSLANADNYAYFSDAVYLKEDVLNQTRADAEPERIAKNYNSNKLGNMTRSEFLSLTPAVRLERFGFEL